MTDWNIQARAHACQNCQKPFADKQPYRTLLFDHRSSYARLDLCEPCWTERSSSPQPDDRPMVSQWQGVFARPPAAPPDPIQKETAESLLRRLVALNDPSYASACFVLAVMLERKRLLKVKAQDRKEGRRVIVYEDPRTGDLFTVPDPGLRLDQLEPLQHEVMRLLQHGLPQATGSGTGIPSDVPPGVSTSDSSGSAPSVPDRGVEPQTAGASATDVRGN